MPRRPMRFLLVVLTVLALVLPRMSAVAASVVPGTMTVVICTGQGMVTLRIDENGNPVPDRVQSDHCVLSQSADTAVRAEIPAIVAPVIDQVKRPSGHLIRAEGYRAARPPPRAPPAI